MDIVTQALTNFFQELQQFIVDIFDSIFGLWNYGILFSWLPADIIAAVDFLIIFLFGLALIKFIRSIIPS